MSLSPIALSRDLSFTPGVTKVPGATQDNLQDRAVEHDRLIARSDFNWSDDFVRAAVGDTMWSAVSGAPTVITDFASDGMWAASLAPAAGASIAVRTAALPWRTNDLRFFARCRVSTMTAAGSNVSLYPAGTKLYFKAAIGSANWKAGVNGVETDTGVAWAATYQHLDIVRRNSVAYFFIGGVLVHSAAHTDDMTADLTGFEANAAGGGTATLIVDAIKFSSVRA
jgi:hypothetical protein